MTKNEVSITFNPNPVQRLFIESRATADLFSSRMGEGKSAALAWAVFYHTRHNPGANWVFIRDTWENLRATSLKEFLEWFPDGVFGRFHHTHKEFTWNPDIATGTVSFIGLDDPTDASKLQSRPLAGIAMDEAAPSAVAGGVSELVFDIAMSRLRQPGMKWYACKIAENNPDETHWTYRRFVVPGTEGFKVWQPTTPENIANLPPNYYSNLRHVWAHRPDLQSRFIDGRFGFQQIGKAVTPEWADGIHLATGLYPIRGLPCYFLWDFGLNPTWIATQITPQRHWHVLDALVGEDVGIAEFVEAAVRPVLATKYRRMTWSHIGDPAGMAREQSSANVSAVKMLRKMIGGSWRPGPRRWEERLEPLRAILRQTAGGVGVVRVDREHAQPVWHALRGGWHYHVGRTGLVGAEALKNIHSHPGDAMGYGAAILFPPAKTFGAPLPKGLLGPSRRGSYFEQADQGTRFRVPEEARRLG